MTDWLVDYPTDNYRTKVATPLMAPAFEVRGKRIFTENGSLPLAQLNSIEQYIGLLFCIRGKQVTQRFDNWLRNGQISNQLERLSGITRSGKIWVDNSGCVLALEILDIHEEYKSRQINAHPLMHEIFADDDPWNWDATLPLRTLQVNPDSISKRPMTDEMLSFCTFFEDTTPSRVERGVIGLSVSGWDLKNMQKPNDFIQMLAYRYDEILLLVDPKTRFVRFIRATIRE